MWHARTKNDLIIEVWEKLDCENVGADEINAISTVVSHKYGNSAVDSPMVIARLLADEGAELRHSEIMELYVSLFIDRPHDAALRNILKIDSLKIAAASIKNLENLRRKYKSENDKNGLGILRETALRSKKTAIETSERKNVDSATVQINVEIAEWLTIWLQTPEVFENWLELRQKSPDFVNTFAPSDK